MRVRQVAFAGLAVMALFSMATGGGAQPAPPGSPGQGPAGAERRPDPPPREQMPRPEWEVPGPMLAEAPGAQMPGADPFHLLLNSTEVQSDLGLTQDQLERLARAARNFRTKLQELSYPRPGVPKEQAQSAIQSHVMDTRGMIARELNPEQLARLQQIMLQLEGPCLAVVDPQLGQQLSITRDQGRAIGEVCRARAAQMRQAFHPPASKTDVCAQMAVNRDQIELIRARSDEQVMTLLSPQQKSMFVRMTGRRINLQPPMPPECG